MYINREIGRFFKACNAIAEYLTKVGNSYMWKCICVKNQKGWDEARKSSF